MTNIPVAIGSSVPAWPTFRVPAILRVRDTTSWDVQPAGLSTSISPETSPAMLLFLVRVFVARIGCGIALSSDFCIQCFGFAQYFFELCCTFGNRVADEFQGWNQTDVEASTHFTA